MHKMRKILFFEFEALTVFPVMFILIDTYRYILNHSHNIFVVYSLYVVPMYKI